MRNGPHANVVGIVALLCIFVGAPLVGTGHAFELILLIAVAAVAVLLWRPLQAWSARLEAGQPAANAGALERRVEQLEALVDGLNKQQAQLQETLRWQEQLLRHPAAEPAAIPRAPVSAP